MFTRKPQVHVAKLQEFFKSSGIATSVTHSGHGLFIPVKLKDIARLNGVISKLWLGEMVRLKMKASEVVDPGEVSAEQRIHDIASRFKPIGSGLVTQMAFKSTRGKAPTYCGVQVIYPEKRFYNHVAKD